MPKVVKLSTMTQEGPHLNPGVGKEFNNGICKYLPHLRLSYVISMFDC